MKENSDNSNLDSKKDVKNLMKYFNYTKKNSLSKSQITNKANKTKVNLSLIYKEYINKYEINENEKKNNNIIENDNYYHEIINKNLDELKNDTITFLEDIKNKISKNYFSFSENINMWLNNRDKKISKILINSEKLDIFINYMKKNIFDKIKNIFEIHNYIFNSIKEHFTLLNLFLEENNLVKYNCPLEEFVLKNSNLILNSWFLSKINMKTLCLSKFIDNENLGDLFKNYFSKKKEEILFKSINLKSDIKRNYIYEPNLSKYTFTKINKLKIESMSGDNINKIYKKITKGDNYSSLDNNKIKIISLSNLDLFISSVEKLNKLNFPILEKLKIKKCIIPHYCQNIFQTFISKTINLKSLKIENVKLTDKSFYDFISFVTKNKSMLDTIECLSFKDNYLNSINFNNLAKSKLKFNNLELFDLSNNNIYNFSINNFKILPKLLILDISHNNINNNLLFEAVNKSRSKKKINFIVLMCKNIFLYNINDNNKKYIQYLNDNLINCDYKIKNINL